MLSVGREFYFPFSHCTRVDLAFAQVGNLPTDVEITVHDAGGTPVHTRHFLAVSERTVVTTRHDAKSDNLARFVGAATRRFRLERPWRLPPPDDRTGPRPLRRSHERTGTRGRTASGYSRERLAATERQRNGNVLVDTGL